MTLIGLCGKLKSGKDTVFEILRKIDSTATRLSFADPLKREVAAACGVSVDYINAHKDNFRLILQGWGTDFRRELHGSKYWVGRAQESLNQILRKEEHSIQGTLVVFTDVRFPNEVEFIRENGGHVWEVRRWRGWREWLKGLVVNRHASEALKAEVDEVIENNSTLDELSKAVEAAYVRTIEKAINKVSAAGGAAL